MGLYSSVSRVWLSVSFGRLRQKASKGDPGAISRELQNGDLSWAIEHNSLSGILDGVGFKDGEYGKQWTLFISDGDEHFGVNISEGSIFCDDLLKRIPNMRKGERYKITPYDFDDDSGKRKTGLSIKKVDDDDNEIDKVDSFYEKFKKDPETGKVTVDIVNGMPVYDGPKGDKEEFKIYLIKRTKFLRSRALEYVKQNFPWAPSSGGGHHTENSPPPDDIPMGDDPMDPGYTQTSTPEDDLPF